MQEIFEYQFTKLDPISGDHIDPPSVAIYETLLTKDDHGRAAPGLADSWDVSEDGLRWRLRIRAGATFHSGDRCDAAAVVQALELCRWGDGLPRQIWYWDPLEQVRALDDDVVELSLHYPCARLPALLWGTHTAIVNAATRSRLGEDFGRTAADGTGPYRLVDYTAESVLAEAWSADGSALPDGRPDRIRWRSIRDEAERVAALALPDVDVVRAVDHDAAGPGSPWHVDAQLENSQFYLALNFQDPRGFADLELRRAIEAFIDREELVREGLGGRGDGRRSPIPAADEFADAFDPTSARPMTEGEATATLARLGYSRGRSGVLERDGVPMQIDCVVQDTGQFHRVAAVLSRHLRAAGIELACRFLDPFEPFYRAVEDGPASFINKWLWPDAMEALMGFSRASCIGPGGGNWQFADVPGMDLAHDQFLRATSAAELQSASEHVQRLFMSQLPFIPLCSPLETLAVRPRVTGLALSARTLYPLYDRVAVRRDGTAP
jgi:peptide/nickel transport system substrate-binding protein